MSRTGGGALVPAKFATRWPVGTRRQGGARPRQFATRRNP